jgi:hypothetical protein
MRASHLVIKAKAANTKKRKVKLLFVKFLDFKRKRKDANKKQRRGISSKNHLECSKTIGKNENIIVVSSAICLFLNNSLVNKNTKTNRETKKRLITRELIKTGWPNKRINIPERVWISGG